MKSYTAYSITDNRASRVVMYKSSIRDKREGAVPSKPIVMSNFIITLRNVHVIFGAGTSVADSMRNFSAMGLFTIL